MSPPVPWLIVEPMLRLHEAIVEVLSEVPTKGLTSSEIAAAINERASYVRPSDGMPLEAKQIAARVRRPTYRGLFEVDGSMIHLRP